MNFTSTLFKSRTKKTIFIVEDNPVFAKVLKTYLLAKFRNVDEVVVFSTGDFCLAELHRNPSAIIIDYFLGTTCNDASTGLDTIVQIKARQSEANIIVLSAWKEEEIPTESFKDLQYSYVEKNVDAFKKVETLIRTAWQ